MSVQIADIIQEHIQERLAGIHTAIPGKIQSYEAPSKKAEVALMMKQKYQDRELPYPVVSGVPVIFPGSADAQVSFPLKKGDGCLLICSERSLDEYLASGRAEVPADSRRFSLTDAVCVPGLFSFSSPGLPGATDRLQIKYKDAELALTDAGEITLNGDSKSFVTHAELDAALQTFIASLNTHTHPTPSGPSSVPTAPMSIDISAAGTITIKTGG